MAFNLNPFNKQGQYQGNTSQDIALQNNSNFTTFKSVNNDIERIVAMRSIVNQKTTEQTAYANPFWQTFGIDADMLVLPVASNKQERLLQYRRISKYPECDWCLDEICDEFIHEDENGKFINLKLPEDKKQLTTNVKRIIQEEFERYINLFRLRDDGYGLIKRFLIEGELAWENVIKKNIPDLGIVGIKFLPAEYYDTLLDLKTNSPVGLLFDAQNFAADTRQVLTNNMLAASNVFNTMIPTTTSIQKDLRNCIPLLWSQVTYIRSHDIAYDGDKYIAYPILEKAKQAYYQLALLQDAAVILRVTRAPERLLYNISTGKMNDNYAKQYVRDFANGLKAKHVMQAKGPGNKGVDIGSVYNPISMLETYVFGKSDGNDGTTVETVGSTANYEQMEDIKYFLRRFMKQFKIPFSRFETPENEVPSKDQLSHEEHAFLRMIVRFQRQFALGFKNGFITDLKLRGMWEKYELHDEDIDIQFVKPSLYEQYEVQQLVEIKMDIFEKALANEEGFSRMYAMKKFLNLTDDEIKENFECLMKEKMIEKLTEMYADQVKDHKGLDGWENPIKYKDQAEKEITELKNTEKAADDTTTDEETENSEEENSEEENNEEPSFGLQ